MEPVSTTKPRASKAERREKQRSTNLLRIEKMHKARLEFTPPPALASTALPRVNVGCSGWFYWDWKNTFYPEGMPTSEWFRHYRSVFGTVELNAPFYGWPTVATVKSWRKQVEDEAGHSDFVYTVKAAEMITHLRKFVDVGDLVLDFGLIADLLGPRMGCLLYQLPPSYSFTEERLDDIVREVDPARRNVVEFRHKSWWNDRVYSAFEAAGIIFCSISAPRLPDDMVKTADEVYVRFHGPEKWYRYYYSDAELAGWAAKIEATRPARIWAYFNNDYDRFAVRNAMTLRSMLAG